MEKSSVHFRAALFSDSLSPPISYCFLNLPRNEQQGVGSAQLPELRGNRMVPRTTEKEQAASRLQDFLGFKTCQGNLCLHGSKLNSPQKTWNLFVPVASNEVLVRLLNVFKSPLKDDNTCPPGLSQQMRAVMISM